MRGLRHIASIWGQRRTSAHDSRFRCSGVQCCEVCEGCVELGEHRQPARQRQPFGAQRPLRAAISPRHSFTLAALAALAIVTDGCCPLALAMAGRRPTAVTWSPPSDEPSLSPQFGLLGGPELHSSVAFVEGFLSREEVLAVHALASDDGTWEVNDRGSEVQCLHQVWRIESVLRGKHDRLYRKLTHTAWSIDHQLWQNLCDFVYPEIEYIEYDVMKLGKAGSFGKHTDNDSLVSMVALITDPAEFVGGVNCFRGSPGLPGPKVALQLGDAVFFYGDKCEHWITPVESGRRVVLQMELRRSQDAAKRRIAASQKHTRSGGRRR